MWKFSLRFKIETYGWRKFWKRRNQLERRWTFKLNAKNSRFNVLNFGTLKLKIFNLELWELEFWRKSGLTHLRFRN